jgi:adenine-specific DNA methylase
MTPIQTAETLVDTALLRKARGAFFTPREISKFIAGWAIRTAEDLALEPSCGEASFLLSVGERLKALKSEQNNNYSQLIGVEIHDSTAREAESLLVSAGFSCRIETADFFDVPPNPVFDAVVGNPPYVRYQDFNGRSRTRGLEAALAQGVRFNLLANSWAPFVIHAAQFVKPTGRLGLVLPAELLSVKYASQVRRFLLDRFASIKLIMFDELVFPDVLEEVVLLLAEGTGPTTGFELYQARNLTTLESPIRKGWKRFNPEAVDKWTSALLTSNALDTYRKLLQGKRVERLIDWGESYLGAVTGNNRFFTLTTAQVTELNLSKSDVVAISPPGSRHLRGLTFTKRAWSELSSHGSRCHLFYPSTEEQSTAAAAYIGKGEHEGVNKAYKCKVRKPWWRVPLVPIPDLFLTYMDHECPRLITNEADLFHLNSLYGLRLKADRCRLGRDLLPLSTMNSLTLLGAEIIGRSYGGGILKLEPNEADQLPFPSEDLLEASAAELRALKPQLAISLRQGDISRIVKSVDAILLKKHLGITSLEIRRLREARRDLFARRVSRGKRN